jgi:hypothetical protein
VENGRIKVYWRFKTGSHTQVWDSSKGQYIVFRDIIDQVMSYYSSQVPILDFIEGDGMFCPVNDYYAYPVEFYFYPKSTPGYLGHADIGPSCDDDYPNGAVFPSLIEINTSYYRGPGVVLPTYTTGGSFTPDYSSYITSTLFHYLGHALGLDDEQKRADATGKIGIYKNSTQHDPVPGTGIAPIVTGSYNVITNGTPDFDFQSVMLFTDYAQMQANRLLRLDARNYRTPILPKTSLSSWDIFFITYVYSIPGKHLFTLELNAP